MSRPATTPAFLFDLDGTLIDSVYQHVTAWRAALSATTLPRARELLKTAMPGPPGSGWLETISNLQQVGRNGLHRYNTSDHSMLTAMRAVENVIAGTKHDLWAVNAESAYHEEHQEHHQQSDGNDHAHGAHDHDVADHAHGSPQGIEWEDDMVDVNRMTTPANMRWQLVDRSDGAVNAAIDWRFRVGDQVKIRLVNEMDSDHPMPHPFHIHGAGRFLILARDHVPEPNLVWKDTVLVRTGETVDILLDVTNPGVWMAHCHIAEHHESGMMFSFRVDDAS